MLHNTCGQRVSSTTEYPESFGYAMHNIEGYYCAECSVSVSHDRIFYGEKNDWLKLKGIRQ